MYDLLNHEDEINTDYCNTIMAQYLQNQWGITVGYNTVPLEIVKMRKKLLEWLQLKDCVNSLCTSSLTGQAYTVLSLGGMYSPGECVLNPILYAHDPYYYKDYPTNVNDIIIPTFD